MPELPSPKEVLMKVAEFHDKMTEAAITPIRELASNIGLPEPPEPPKAADIVESLPDLELPALELPIPIPGTQASTEGEVGKGEVAKLKLPSTNQQETIKFKIV